MRRKILPILLAASVCAVAAPQAAQAAQNPCGGSALLPQLDPSPPHRLQISRATIGGRQHDVLAFASYMANVGRGPFKVVGRRSRSHGAMRATQVIACRGGEHSAGTAGSMRYVRKPTHQHFHLMHLERYRLMSLDGREVDRADKRGFCLGDTAEAGITLAKQAPERVFDADKTTACGARRPGSHRVVLGLSVGWGDSYLPFVEGQYVDLEGLPAGDYRVLNETDPFGHILDGNTADNVAGTDVRISWPNGANGAPAFQEIGHCETRSSCLSTAPANDTLAERGLTSYASAAEALEGPRPAALRY